MEETKSNSQLNYSEGAALPTNAPSWAVAASERLKQRREEGYKSSCDPPPGVNKVLLHSCCAPCSGAMVEEMCSSDTLDEVVVFFYNPNIREIFSFYLHTILNLFANHPSRLLMLTIMFLLCDSAHFLQIHGKSMR